MVRWHVMDIAGFVFLVRNWAPSFANTILNATHVDFLCRSKYFPGAYFPKILETDAHTNIWPIVEAFETTKVASMSADIATQIEQSPTRGIWTRHRHFRFATRPNISNATSWLVRHVSSISFLRSQKMSSSLGLCCLPTSSARVGCLHNLKGTSARLLCEYG
jgi:hypothetical protein